MRKTWTPVALASAVSLSAAACGGTAPAEAPPAAAVAARPSRSARCTRSAGQRGRRPADGQRRQARGRGDQRRPAASSRSAARSSRSASGDTQGKPEVGQSEAQRLIQEGAVALVGTYQSAVSPNVAAVAERNKVPFVMDVTGEDGVLTQGYKYTFRIQPPQRVDGRAGAQVPYGDVRGGRQAPPRRWPSCTSRPAFGTGVQDAFKAKAAQARHRGRSRRSATTRPACPTSPPRSPRSRRPGANVLAVAGYYRDSVLAAQGGQHGQAHSSTRCGASPTARSTSRSSPPTPAPPASGYFDTNYRLRREEPADPGADDAVPGSVQRRDPHRRGARLRRGPGHRRRAWSGPAAPTRRSCATRSPGSRSTRW